MIEKLKKIKEKYEELTKELIDPNVLADMSVWQKKSIRSPLKSTMSMLKFKMI